MENLKKEISLCVDEIFKKVQSRENRNLKFVFDPKKIRKQHSLHLDATEINLMVIADNRHNYIETFANTKIKVGDKSYSLHVEQAMWDEIRISVYEPTKKNPFGVLLDLKKKYKDVLKGSNQGKFRTFKPDFLLIRNKPRGTEQYDYRNVFFGLIYAGIPSVNSLESIYYCLERVLVHAELKKIQKRMGKEKFPLIDQYYHCSGADVNFIPGSYPIVGKVSFTHAGIGKTIIKNKDRLRDFRSVVKLHNDYVTTEPFVDADYELRLYKIGSHYRAFKKRLVSYWKSNSMGTAVHEDIEISSLHKSWLDECSKLFGGLDIFALDVLHSEKEDRYVILELNGTSIGLGPNHLLEDLEWEKEIVLEKIKEKLFPKQEKKQDKIPNTNNEAIEVETINLENTFMSQKKEIRNLDTYYKQLLNKNKYLKQLLKKM